MASKPKIIYWDSCVFISAIQETPGRYEILQKILRAAQTGEIVILTSALAIAEVARCYSKNDPAHKVKSFAELTNDLNKIKAFFDNDYISVYQVDRAIANEAADISLKYPLFPQDAIHIATAILRPCLHLQTYDGENKGRRGKLLSYDNKIGSPPKKIIIPQWPLPGMQGSFGLLD
jgi:predicted nucleic acid-binding protein